MDAAPLASLPVGALSIVRTATAAIANLYAQTSGRVLHITGIWISGKNAAAFGTVTVTVTPRFGVATVVMETQFPTLAVNSQEVNTYLHVGDLPTVSDVAVATTGTAPTSFRVVLIGWEETLP